LAGFEGKASTFSGEGGVHQAYCGRLVDCGE